MISPSSVSMNAEVVVTSLLPKGPNGTLAVTARYSGFTPGGETEFASVTSHSVGGGLSTISFPTTRGCRFWKLV